MSSEYIPDPISDIFGNLTPRGLLAPVYSSNQYKSKCDTEIDADNLEFMLFVWSGISVDPLLKTIAIAKSLKLEKKLNSDKSMLLRV